MVFKTFVIAARELDLDGLTIATGQRPGRHARLRVLPYKASSTASRSFFEAGIPTQGKLTEQYELRIYISRRAPEYSIVELRKARSLGEFDYRPVPKAPRTIF